MKFFNRGPAPSGKLTRWDVAALLLILSFFAAILMPVYSQNWMASRIFVYDANGDPVPFARLTFADANGTTNYFTITNEKGESRDPIAIRLAKQVSGPYKFHHMDWNSKGPYMWIISARGTQTFTVKDEHGKPVPDLPVYLGFVPGMYQFPHRTSRPGEALLNRTHRTDRNGAVILSDVALCQRMEPYIDEPRFGKAEYVVQSVRVTTGSDRVDYDIRVSRPATVTGIVRAASGKPVTGHEVFAVKFSESRRIISVSHHLTTRTDANGRFRLTGLPAGDYAFYWSNPRTSSLSILLSATRCVVLPGEAKQVALRIP